MSLLTGKARADFENWFIDNKSVKEYADISLFHRNDVIVWFYDADPVIQNAFIIEWFDSLGIWKDMFYETDQEILDGNLVSWNYTIERTIELLNIQYNKK